MKKFLTLLLFCILMSKIHAQEEYPLFAGITEYEKQGSVGGTTINYTIDTIFNPKTKSGTNVKNVPTIICIGESSICWSINDDDKFFDIEEKKTKKRYSIYKTRDSKNGNVVIWKFKLSGEIIEVRNKSNKDQHVLLYVS